MSPNPEDKDDDTVMHDAEETEAPPAEDLPKDADAPQDEALGETAPVTIESLQKELQVCVQEKAELQIENSALKEEVEHLKAQVLALETADVKAIKSINAKTPTRGVKRTIGGIGKTPGKALPKTPASEPPNPGKRAVKWETRFEQLEEFHKTNGHVNLNKRNAASDLAMWVNDQRTQHRLLREGHSSTMTADRIQRLRGLGFQFTVTKSPPLPWEERYQQLVAYKEANNHCNVQQLCQASPAGLGNWVLEQRRKYKLLQEGRTRGTKVGTLTAERIAKLEELGFQWKLRDRNDKRTRKSDVKLTDVEQNDVLAAAQQLASSAVAEQKRAPDVPSAEEAAAAAAEAATTADEAATEAVSETVGQPNLSMEEALVEAVVKRETV